MSWVRVPSIASHHPNLTALSLNPRRILGRLTEHDPVFASRLAPSGAGCLEMTAMKTARTIGGGWAVVVGLAVLAGAPDAHRPVSGAVQAPPDGYEVREN